ncbi:MAG: indolepyruvate ferredoxin oxidoreductase subunit alpha [Clostridiaceae bacterium]|nr:indolepyruvate ferredoxin oxidoreductase subunit alpha [Clostridiaceae bacterium]
MKELLMGNEAIAVGALVAGVQVVAGYPGTPSSEALETAAARNPGNVYVEWSTNEKAALEVAAGASYAGARTLVTMKQVGLNVASDPMMCVNYIGVRGGMVVFVADDPGPISSQTEQDTRHFAKYAKIPVFDASSPEEVFTMVQDAFAFSEKHTTPVILRATTRVCHSCATIDVPEIKNPPHAPGFEKDPGRWVIFPRLSYQNKLKLEARESVIAREFSDYGMNTLQGSGRIGIACGGVSYAYVMDVIAGREKSFTVFKVATPFPFPEELAACFLRNVDRVIVFEELDPVIEDALIYLCGKRGMRADIHGKRTNTVPRAGELSAITVAEIIERIFGVPSPFEPVSVADAPAVPPRPPVLCAGCPHRASFYAVKRAMQGKRAVFCGDIGCYTLGNAAPLGMVDTCLCMGAGITIAQGLDHAWEEGVCFSFVGDSTFFASGLTGVVNAVYNKANIVLVVLDNSTTAMTGHQPHPGIGRTMMKEQSNPISIEAVLRSFGIDFVRTVNPLDHKEAVETVKEAAKLTGVRAIIFKAPCIAVVKPTKSMEVDESMCIGCKRCIRELGCPGLSFVSGHAVVDDSLCNGCMLCAQICPKGCIRKKEDA